MGPRCTETCRYPCAKDHRTKAEKIAAMAVGATTPGEKAAAEAAAKRHPVPEQPKVAGRQGWRPTARGPINADTFGPNSRTYHTPLTREQVDEFFARVWGSYTPPTSEEARPAGRQASERAHQEELDRELLKREQAKERLRRTGFVDPSEAPADFASTGPRNRPPATESYRDAMNQQDLKREQEGLFMDIVRATNRGAISSNRGQELYRAYTEGKMDANTVRQRMREKEE